MGNSFATFEGMKRTIVACSLALLGLGAMCQDLPEVPRDSLEWRLQMAGEQSIKASRSRDTSLAFLLVGGVITTLAADKSANVYNANVPIGMGILTAAGFFTFQYKAIRHERNQGRYLLGHQ